jgi:hypothetical protein
MPAPAWAPPLETLQRLLGSTAEPLPPAVEVSELATAIHVLLHVAPHDPKLAGIRADCSMMERLSCLTVACQRILYEGRWDAKIVRPMKALATVCGHLVLYLITTYGHDMGSDQEALVVVVTTVQLICPRRDGTASVLGKFLLTFMPEALIDDVLEVMVHALPSECLPLAVNYIDQALGLTSSSGDAAALAWARDLLHNTVSLWPSAWSQLLQRAATRQALEDLCGREPLSHPGVVLALASRYENLDDAPGQGSQVSRRDRGRPSRCVSFPPACLFHSAACLFTRCNHVDRTSSASWSDCRRCSSWPRRASPWRWPLAPWGPRARAGAGARARAT